jgi:hypothetical protein
MKNSILNRRQQAILCFLYSYSQSNGFYPTIRETSVHHPEYFMACNLL